MKNVWLVIDRDVNNKPAAGENTRLSTWFFQQKKKIAVFKKATVFFSYYPPIKCHFPSVINLSYIPG